MKKGKAMFIIITYAVFSSLGILLLKLGVSKELEINLNGMNIMVKMNVMVLMGLTLYIVSFVLSLIAMRTTNLSLFYPLSTGIAYILICIFSFAILKESIAARQAIGMIFILIGAIFMNLK